MRFGRLFQHQFVYTILDAFTYADDEGLQMINNIFLLIDVLIYLPYSYFTLVRLVNGSSSSEGRVEVYHDGIWGTVCDYSWGSPESRVLCRSLGFPDELASFPNAYFGEGIVRSLLIVSYCNGDENSIFDCCHYGIGYGCGHEDDVGVRCQPNGKLFCLICHV